MKAKIEKKQRLMELKEAKEKKIEEELSQSKAEAEKAKKKADAYRKMKEEWVKRKEEDLKRFFERQGINMKYQMESDLGRDYAMRLDQELYEKKMQDRPHYWNSPHSLKGLAFTSFAHQYHRERIGDAFFIPLQVWTAVIVSLLTISYIFLTYLSTVQGLHDQVIDFRMQVEDGFFEIMFRVLKNFRNSMPGVQFPEKIFNDALYIIRFIGD